VCEAAVTVLGCRDGPVRGWLSVLCQFGGAGGRRVRAGSSIGCWLNADSWLSKLRLGVQPQQNCASHGCRQPHYFNTIPYCRLLKVRLGVEQETCLCCADLWVAGDGCANADISVGAAAAAGVVRRSGQLQQACERDCMTPSLTYVC
jgi:hypothetical protein